MIEDFQQVLLWHTRPTSQGSVAAGAAQAPANAMHSDMEAGDCAVQPSVFATTTSFTTTHGFAVPALDKATTAAAAAAPAHGAPSAPAHAPALPAVLTRLQSLKDNDSGASSNTYSSSVGWKGLLEISRAAGGSGVLGGVGSLGADSTAAPPMEVCCTAHTTAGVKRLIKSVNRGLKACQEPERATDGMGGCYFFRDDKGCQVGIFKPCDEEALAPCNPKGFVGRQLGDPGWKATVRVGEAGMREVAAYLLDHEHFARVPHTVLVRAAHPVFHYATNQTVGSMKSGTSFAASAPLNTFDSAAAAAVAAMAAAAVPAPTGSSSGAQEGWSAHKLGSLQEFVHHVADTSEFGTSRLSARDVHRIGILDLRLFNTDRHAGNILVCRRKPGSSGSSGNGSRACASSSNLRAALPDTSEYELIPIDHGFCLPEALDAPFFEWLHWSQALLPFDDDELDYIARLDVQADIRLLQTELPNLRPECLHVLEVSTTLLQRCAAAGLTLAEIGGVMTRQLDVLDDDEGVLSEFERICVAARQAVETRELVALASASSGSSGDCHFSLREEDEEGELVEQEDERISATAMGQQVQGRADALVMGGAQGTSAAAAASAAGGCGASEMGSCGSDMSVAIVGLASSLSACMAQVREGEQLLFEWDEDGASPKGAAVSSPTFRLQHTPSAEHHMALSPASHASVEMGMASPRQHLAGASLGSGEQSPESPVHFSVGSSSARAIPNPPPKLTHATSALPAPAPVARSMQTSDAFLRRSGGLKGPPAVTARRKRGITADHAPSAAAARGKVPYPPPIIAAAPRSANEVLSGLDAAQWRLFMAELVALMDEALAKGQWKAADVHGAVAMSCPRF